MQRLGASVLHNGLQLLPPEPPLDRGDCCALQHAQQAMALGALPQNALSTAQHLGVMADEIWYLAGDRSTDLQWYSRRGLLIGLYTATGTRTAAARTIFLFPVV